MKKILGLDLGTNSIGWAVVEIDENNNPIQIEGMGSRIIPMGSDKIDYEKGATITKNADRRAKRSARRMSKRYKMRRNKLLFILDKLNMLPNQFQLKNGFPSAEKLQELELLPIKRGSIQLDSLQHYELREKALKGKITPQEYGSILYQYNRLRGYSGGGNDEDEQKKKKNSDNEQEENKKYETRVQKFLVKSVSQSDATFKVKGGKDKGKELPVYDLVVLDDDVEVIGTTQLQNLEEKVGEEIELEIRIKRSKKGENVSFALPQKTNWRKQMEETEKCLREKQYYPCQLFAEELRKNKWSKIRNRVILRQQYTKEFDAVWDEQAKYYPFLNNCPKETLFEIVNYIFPGQSDSQKQLREEGLQRGLRYIIKEQVIYYQRPLKPQTELIGKCQFEQGEKVIPTSHPLFQEFRCWDQINRLYITSKQLVRNERKKKDVYQYANRYLTNEQKKMLYKRLQKQKQLGFNEVAKIVGLKNDNSECSEFLNGLNVKAKLKGCDTAIAINKVLGCFSTDDSTIITRIWQALYDNVHEGSEYDESSKRIRSIVEALPNDIDDANRIRLALNLAQSIQFSRKYAGLSKKAIENILPIMQLKPRNIPEIVRNNFEKVRHLIDTGEVVDEALMQDYIVDFVQKNPNAIEHGGLMYAFASSLVYGRHTKENVKPQIKNYHDIRYVERNLRNPIVEQIVNETMQVVKSVWKQYKLNPNELEIRVELARDLKNSAQEREKIYKGQIKSRKTNDEIKKKLIELNQEVNDRNIEMYKLWSKQESPFDKDGKPLSRPKYKDEKSPTREEVEKMRLWEEQHYLDPYTLKPIPLSLLFSSDRLYDIDHVIPKSRFFDDSLANKVVCSTTINEEKDNRTAWEYISQQNSKYGICTIEKYIENVNKNFFGQKRKNLLAEKIPSNPVARQMKDTQYISVAIKDELAKIVGSNNVKSTTGGVTDYLRSHWGLRKMFMELTEPRFKQMEMWNVDEEERPNESWVTKYVDKENNKHVYEIKGWSKRYDHRHHAIDALVVALSNEKYIKRLNDLNKYFQDELAKRKESIPVGDDESLEEAFFKLEKEKREGIMKEIEGSKKFEVPMKNLVSEVRKQLETMIVSQKPKDKLAVKEDKDGKRQLKIRSALHQETYYGKTNNRDTKTVNISNLKAKDISQIVDPVLQKEIDAHRKKFETMKEAFTGEGLIAFNESRFQTKNETKLKPPVYNVKLWYSKKEKEDGDLQRLYDDNPKKSVVTGDNYLFVVMEKGGERVFDIASLYDSVLLAKEKVKESQFDIEQIKRNVCESIRIADQKDKKGNVLPKPDRVLFYLQQNDLVYMPRNVDDEVLRFDPEELKRWLSVENNRREFAERIYRVVKYTGKDCFFIPNNYAKEICMPKNLSAEEIDVLKRDKYPDKKIPKQELNYIEFGTYSNCTPAEKNELFTKSMREGKKYKGERPRKIQEYCIKIKVDWLGNVIEFNGQKL